MYIGVIRRMNIRSTSADPLDAFRLHDDHRQPTVFQVCQCYVHDTQLPALSENGPPVDQRLHVSATATVDTTVSFQLSASLLDADVYFDVYFPLLAKPMTKHTLFCSVHWGRGLNNVHWGWLIYFWPKVELTMFACPRGVINDDE